MNPSEMPGYECLINVEVKVKQEAIDDDASDDMLEFADQITYATEIVVPEVKLKKDKKTIKKDKTVRDETRLPVKKRKRRNKGSPRGRPRVHFEIDDRNYPRKCDHVSICHILSFLGI